MQIEIKPAGYFRKYLEESEETLTVSLDKSRPIKDILEDLGIDIENAVVRPIIIKDRKTLELDYEVQDGDQIILMNMLTGG